MSGLRIREALFSPKDRADRGVYWAGVLIPVGVINLVRPAAWIVGSLLLIATGGGAVGPIVALAIVYGPVFYCAACLATNRLAAIGLPRWLVVAPALAAAARVWAFEFAIILPLGDRASSLALQPRIATGAFLALAVFMLLLGVIPSRREAALRV